LIEIFHSPHPFVQLEASQQSGDCSVNMIQEATRVWHSDHFWSFVSTDENGVIEIDEKKLEIQQQTADILSDAIISKMQALKISPTQLNALLPHLQQYGW